MTGEEELIHETPAVAFGWIETLQTVSIYVNLDDSFHTLFSLLFRDLLWRLNFRSFLT